MNATNRKICIVIGSVCVSVVLAYIAQGRDNRDGQESLSAATVPEHQVILVEIPISHGPVKDGLAAFLMCQQKQFKVGEPIRLMYGVLFRGAEWDMRIKPRSGAVNLGPELNMPKEECPFWYMAIQRPSGLFVRTFHSRLSITGPDGNEVPWVRGPIGCRPIANPNSRIALGPGSFLGKTSLDIHRSYDLNTPGIYTIRWHYRGWHDDRVPESSSWWAGELISNEIQIEIAE